MIKKELLKRMSKIVGPVPEDCIERIDGTQFVVKPNTYSKKGFLVSGEVIDSCSYGGITAIPVAIGYGLTEEQCEDVLKSCQIMCEEINVCMAEGDTEDAKHLCEQILKDICTVLTSSKDKDNETLSDVVRQMPSTCQDLYFKVIDVIRKVPGMDYKRIIANNCHKMSIQSGSFSKVHLKENKEQLLKDMRESYIPFMGESTLEQDHWGMKQIDDDSLLGEEQEFFIKRSTLPFSSVHVQGVESLGYRLGIDLPKGESDRPISPLKKKEGFEKAIAIVDALNKVDDPRLERGIEKLWPRLNIEKESVEWNRVLAIDPDEVPIIIPVIVSEDDHKFPSDYSPIRALEVLDSLTSVTDYSEISGSGNISIEKKFDIGTLNVLEEEFPEDKFPFGGAAPFSPPRRVNDEVQ